MKMNLLFCLSEGQQLELGSSPGEPLQQNCFTQNGEELLEVVALVVVAQDLLLTELQTDRWRLMKGG